MCLDLEESETSPAKDSAAMQIESSTLHLEPAQSENVEIECLMISRSFGRTFLLLEKQFNKQEDEYQRPAKKGLGTSQPPSLLGLRKPKLKKKMSAFPSNGNGAPEMSSSLRWQGNRRRSNGD